MSSLFGGATSNNPSQGIMGGSSSQNAAYPYIQGAESGNVTNGNAAGSQIANMLGLNNGTAQNQGFTNWQNSTGYQFGKQQGMDSITGNAATSGLLNSGGTLKALDTYGQNYANTQYGNYTSQLQSLLGSGNQSAGIISNAGTQSSSNPGVSKFIGQAIGKGSGGS